MKEKINNVIKHFITILKKPEMRVLPGQLAFYLLMSLIPILAISALIASLFISNVDLVTILDGHVPKVVIDILISAIDSASSYNNFALLLVFYIFLSTNGTASIIITSNALYGIQNPSGIQTRIKAIFMTIIIVILLLFILLIPVFGDFIIEFILSLIPKPENLSFYLFVYKTLKILASFFVIFLCIQLIYTLAPDRKIKRKKTVYGAIFTTISWIIVTQVFAFYITNIANYSALYGNFANILVLLTWVYLLAYLFVFGMAINTNVARYDDTKLDGSV